MVKRKPSDCVSRRLRRPSPERNYVKSEEEEVLATPNGQLGASTGQGPINTMEDSLAFMRNVKKYFKDVDPGKHTALGKLIVAQKHGRIAHPCMISQVKELFQGHTELLKLFNEILTPKFKILFEEDVPEFQDLAKLYLAKVKTRSSPSEYTTFLHILYLYQERALTSDKVDQEVEALFANACDLLEEFDCFRPDRAAPVVQSPLHPRHSALEVSKLQREQQRERLQRMCEDVAKRKRKEKGKGVATEQQQQQQRSPPERVSARLANAAIALGNRRSLRSSVEAHPRKPTRNEDATPATETQGRSRSRKRVLKYTGRSMCTPSYLLLKPSKKRNNNGHGDGEGKRKRKAKSESEGEVSVHRSELAKSVLNEECALVRRPKNFNLRTWNRHEKVLFKCEKKQCKCDALMGMLEATAYSFMNYLVKLEESNIGELPCGEELLSPIHKKCIKKLYGDDAQAFIAMLEENPSQALPVILNRLVLKLEELKSHMIKTTPMLLQMYKDNFRLALKVRQPRIC